VIIESLKKTSVSAAISIGGYAMLGANLACAQTPFSGPAPLVGAVGGPVGLLAAGVACGGFLAFKHFRNRR
jgi:hypothetical protein